MSTEVLDLPEVETISDAKNEVEEELPWNVILYNDDLHSFDEVILQVQKATGVALERAVEITLEAHLKGRAVCYTGLLERCEHVAAVLQQIGLTVEIEWTG
ncbi:MAG: ATP-dependent Clp protease adaptor ClpS [Nitrospirae bacterium]|nr:ATP-dependent Clp protease adaptor ClpS [Candidatus Manganitrophaceae bacterium]